MVNRAQSIGIHDLHQSWWVWELPMDRLINDALVQLLPTPQGRSGRPAPPAYAKSRRMGLRVTARL